MTSIQATVRTASPDVEIALVDHRADTCSLFEGLDDARRQQLAVDAWTIGLRAIANAHAGAREGRLEDIGKQLMESLETTLSHRLERQQSCVDAALKDYFDPTDGKVHQKLKDFMDDRGVLTQQLEKYLAPEQGMVARTLAQQVGENSPLFRMLSPTESEGLVKVLEDQLAEVMAKSKDEFGRALDPAVPDSPISRFMTRLKAELETSSTALDAKLGTALASLDAGDENSLLSRLMRETQSTQASLLRAMNPALEDSPLAVLGGTLKGAIEGHATVQKEMLEAQRQRQQTFETEVKGALERIETKGRMAKRTTLGGFDFEDGVIERLREATEAMPCLVTATGDTTGAVRGQRVGDAIVEFDGESAFAGNRIVVEAKRADNYTVASALAEMKRARDNREADVGVFVLSTTSAASPRFPMLARHGADIIVQWDENDAGTDPNLRAAVMLALGLVARTRASCEEGRLDAMNDVEGRIVAEITRLDKVRGYNRTIRKNADNIDLEIGRSESKLGTLLKKAKSTLLALGVDLLEHELHAEEPLVLMSGEAPIGGACPPADGFVDGGASGGDVAFAVGDVGAELPGMCDGQMPAPANESPTDVAASAQDDSDTPADDLRHYIDVLERTHGGRSGNLSFRRSLGWADDRYESVRGRALAAGLIDVGPGRGGVVFLPDDTDAA